MELDLFLEFLAGKMMVYLYVFSEIVTLNFLVQSKKNLVLEPMQSALECFLKLEGYGSLYLFSSFK